MSMTQIISNFWHTWVDLFSGLGLPWGSQTSALMGLVAFFYAIGLAFKILVAPEK